MGPRVGVYSGLARHRWIDQDHRALPGRLLHSHAFDWSLTAHSKVIRSSLECEFVEELGDNGECLGDLGRAVSSRRAAKVRRYSWVPVVL